MQWHQHDNGNRGGPTGPPRFYYSGSADIPGLRDPGISADPFGCNRPKVTIRNRPPVPWRLRFVRRHPNNTALYRQIPVVPKLRAGLNPNTPTSQVGGPTACFPSGAFMAADFSGRTRQKGKGGLFLSVIAKRPTHEPIRRPTREPVRRPMHEPVRRPMHEPVKRPMHEPVKSMYQNKSALYRRISTPTRL